MKKGQALIEMLVGLGLTAALMPALVTSFFVARGGNAQEQVRMQAQGRLREAREVLRLIKEANWTNITTNGTYGLSLNAGIWSLNSTPESNLDGLFSRQIVIAPAYRTSTSQLSSLAPGNTLDPSVKHITITVSWSTPLPSAVIADYYLMRLENLTWLQTTLADFTAGTQTGAAVIDTLGGEVILGSGGSGHADWCAPELTLSSIDLPKSGVANAISAAVGSGSSPNQIVAGTGDNSSGISLGHISVTNANPPIGTVDGSFDGYKTNGVFVLGNYAYIGTDNNSKEVVVIDLSTQDPVTGKYSEAGAFNAPGNGNGNSVYVAGNIGFVTVASKLYTFSVADRTLLGSVSLAGTGAKLVVSGSYAYVAESSGDRALEIIEFSGDGRTLTIRGFALISGQNGVDIIVNSTASRGYLATAQGKVSILDITSPASPSSLGTYDTGGMAPRGIAVVTNNKAIVVGTGGSLQYQVIDLVQETAPVACGGLAIETGVNGIASVQEEDSDTYSYIITGDASAELKIIQGGVGGGGGTYAGDGIFESSIFDAGYSVMFNRFDVTDAAPPPDTSIEYQVAIAPSVDTCAGAIYTFVGPDLTTNTYFTGSTQLPLGSAIGYTNPAQCFKYRAYLRTGNSNSTPILYDFTINFSP